MNVTVLETIATPEPAPAGVVNEAELPFGEQPATNTVAPPKKRKTRKLIPA